MTKTVDLDGSEILVTAAVTCPDMRGIVCAMLESQRKACTDEAGRLGRRVQQIDHWLAQIKRGENITITNAIDNQT